MTMNGSNAMSAAGRGRMVDPENVHDESALLVPAQLANWKGLPIQWLDAASSVSTRDFELPRPVLAMIERGTATAEFAFPGGSKAEHQFIANDLGLFVPAVEFRQSTWHCAGVRRLMVEVDPKSMPDGFLADGSLTRPLALNTGFQDPELAAVLRLMLAEVIAGSPNGALLAQSLSVGVLLRLSMTQQFVRPSSRIGRGQLTSRQLARVEEFVRQNLDGELDLLSMAAAAGLSVAHFTRLFKNTKDQTPHRYVMAKRVEKAQQLISETSLPLALIAMQAGFATQSHMNSMFSRTLGVTPGQCRRDAGTR